MEDTQFQKHFCKILTHIAGEALKSSTDIFFFSVTISEH